MKRTMLAMLLLMPLWSSASFPLRATLAQMAFSADHIFVGTVTGVDMVDGDGNAIDNPAARTGPGLENVIRLTIRVDEMLVTNAGDIPREIKVPLDSSLHYTLGQIQAESGDQAPRLVLLKGPSFAPILAGVFSRPLGDRDEALRLHAQTRRLGNPEGRR